MIEVLPTWKKEETTSNGAAQALCKEYLIVLGRDGCHHQPKDVQKGAQQYRPSWSNHIGHFASNETLDNQ
jgi:hypothetical protein